MTQRHMQIGEVAEQTGLSLRTIRYYEEMGLVVPTARSAGGFRLYAEENVARLQLIKRMKPLEFSLEESKDLLGVLDAIEAGPAADARVDLVGRLEMFHEAAMARVEDVRRQLTIAEEFAAELNTEVERHKAMPNSAVTSG
ncbi:MerR family transcriptional regulator [Nocardioides sp. NPDC006273]|uniref:MerR family transcriptional regulator n=1 Tax=Nocardioides sp. NPDC006273 TaxID=3155598 RepID=UPI0033BE4337